MSKGALGALYDVKPKSKSDGKDGHWLLPIKLHILHKCGCFRFREVAQIESLWQKPLKRKRNPIEEHPIFYGITGALTSSTFK
ncbi:hypothetical protein MCO_00557 [Bartonella sp. DB5-6]|nr:hypothetical protein MCO_00557 [Bartonella sp. DB5-6]